VQYAELIRYCEHKLAYFAVPRYLETVEDLPLTPNGKIQKFVLRHRGITAKTWDRDAAGVTIRR
ncbi:MAG: ATP-dependent acyl-CoA ligase, partial [Pseudolabrys sp.]